MPSLTGPTALERLNQTLAAEIKHRRIAIGASRKALSERAGVSERYIHEVETGRANVSLGILARLAEGLNCDIFALLGVATLHPPLQHYLAAQTIEEQSALYAQIMAKHNATAPKPKSHGLALLGLRGAGKTTLGRLLAERHSLPFVTVTGEIEQRAGMSLADLFNLGGAETYRTIEIEVVTELARAEHPIVLETAGGIAGNAEALDVILAAFETVWLRATPHDHLARVVHQGDLRPLTGHPKALEHLTALLTTREPAYRRAHHHVETSGKTAEQCAQEIEEKVGVFR